MQKEKGEYIVWWGDHIYLLLVAGASCAKKKKVVSVTSNIMIGIKNTSKNQNIVLHKVENR